MTDSIHHKPHTSHHTLHTTHHTPHTTHHSPHTTHHTPHTTHHTPHTTHHTHLTPHTTHNATQQCLGACKPCVHRPCLSVRGACYCVCSTRVQYLPSTKRVPGTHTHTHTHAYTSTDNASAPTTFPRTISPVPNSLLFKQTALFCILCRVVSSCTANILTRSYVLGVHRVVSYDVSRREDASFRSCTLSIEK